MRALTTLSKLTGVISHTSSPRCFTDADSSTPASDTKFYYNSAPWTGACDYDNHDDGWKCACQCPPSPSPPPPPLDMCECTGDGNQIGLQPHRCALLRERRGVLRATRDFLSVWAVERSVQAVEPPPAAVERMRSVGAGPRRRDSPLERSHRRHVAGTATGATIVTAVGSRP